MMKSVFPSLTISFLIICLVSSFSFGQNDSLWNVYRKCKTDSDKINVLFDIGYNYEYYAPDSALATYKNIISFTDKNIGKNPYNKNKVIRRFSTFKAKATMYMGIVVMDQGYYELAMKYYSGAKDIFKELNDNKGVSNCYTNIGIIYGEIGQLQNSLDAYFGALQELIKIGDSVGIARNYNNIGIIYNDMGDFNKSLEYYIKSLKIKEALGDKRGIAQSYNNIGILHKEHGNNKQAIEYYKKSMKLSEEIGDKLSVSDALNNIGNVHCEIAVSLSKKNKKNDSDKEFEICLDYLFRSLNIRTELNDLKGISHCYGNIANIYTLQGKHEMALEFNKKSVAIQKEIGDNAGLASAYGNLCNLYSAIALNSKGSDKNKYLEQSVLYGKMGFDLADELNMLPLKSTISKILMESYKKIGKPAEALEFAEIFIETNDSLFSQDKTKALTEAEKKFETEKKQLQIDKLNKEKELQKSEILRRQETERKQNIIILFIITGLVMLTVFAIFVVHRLRITRKQKLIIEEQKLIVDEKNIVLNQQYEEIRAQRDEISAQRDLVTKQKERIEGQKKEITDSITYALQIQQAMLPDLGFLSEKNDSENFNAVTDYFVFYKPKDIVSGDFYWSVRISGWVIVTVADCTGHGVPGAFMSMLGISFLNEIVRKKEVTEAGEVLNLLRNYVTEALKQKHSSSYSATGVKDGMDIAFCAINTSTLEMQYAGANNPVYIVRNNNNSTNINTLTELKPDPQPVAIHVNMKPFTNQVYQLVKGDCVYLSSDGFQDQFGGEKGKKFMVKRFRDLLNSIADKPMSKQEAELEKAFFEWIGDNKQIDDVTVLGIRI